MEISTDISAQYYLSDDDSMRLITCKADRITLVDENDDYYQVKITVEVLEQLVLFVKVHGVRS